MRDAWQYPQLVVPDAVCVVVCIIAAVTDLRSRRIPNWLTVPAIVGGLLLNMTLAAACSGPAFTVKVALASSAAGCLFLLLVFGLLGFINFVGMGDVKLMAAVGALLRWPTAMWALAYVALAGGVVAVVYALLSGRLGAVLRNLFRIGRRLIPSKTRPEVELHRVPYALAVLLGATWAAALKYFPVLALS